MSRRFRRTRRVPASRWFAALVAAALPLLGATECPPPLCGNGQATTLYLSDNDTAAIFQVTLEQEPFVARLTHVTTAPSLQQPVGHIAATRDGSRIYHITPGKRLSYYDVAGDFWVDLGPVDGMVQGFAVVQAVIDVTSSVLYVGQKEFGIGRIDLIGSPSSALLVASDFTLFGGTPRVSGGDLAFGLHGDLYQANRDQTVSRLYRIQLDPSNPLQARATQIGLNMQVGVSGLATYPFLDADGVMQERLAASFGIEANGSGSSEIRLLDPAVGTGSSPIEGGPFPFVDAGGAPFTHRQGDLTTSTCF